MRIKHLKHYITGILLLLLLSTLVPICAFAEGEQPLPTVTNLKTTYLSFKSSTITVDYSSDVDALDQVIYDKLALIVYDESNQKIDFSKDDILLSYNRSPGIQRVFIEYKGNDTYRESSANATVKINELEGTMLLMVNTVPKITLTDNNAVMDDRVYNALNIKVIDNSKKGIVFSQKDIELSYNRDSGDQVVTVKYKGNSQYAPSMSETTIQIENQEAVTIKMVSNIPKINYASESDAMDKAVFDALKIQILNGKKKPIVFTKEDLNLSYNRVAGKQEVTVKYLGNNSYAPALSSGFVQIIHPAPSALILNTKPKSVSFEKSSTKLDAAIYKNLDIILVDQNNKPITVKEKKDITLNYKHEEGQQSVLVTYSGNENYLSCSAETTITIGPQKSFIYGLVIAITAGVMILLIVGVIIIKKRKQKSNAKK